MAEAETHLSGCAACRERLARLQAMESCVRESLAERPPSPDFSRSVMRTLAREAKSRQRGWTWMWTSAAACIAAGALLGGMLGPHVFPSKPPVIASGMIPGILAPNTYSPISEAGKRPTSPGKEKPSTVASLPCKCRIPARERGEGKMKRPTGDDAPKQGVSITERTSQASHLLQASPTSIALADSTGSGIEPKGLNDARLIITPDMEKPTTP
jgi:hypothetical protein